MVELGKELRHLIALRHVGGDFLAASMVVAMSVSIAALHRLDPPWALAVFAFSVRSRERRCRFVKILDSTINISQRSRSRDRLIEHPILRPSSDFCYGRR